MPAPRSIVAALAPVATALGVNAVPVAAVFAADAPPETVMVLYFMENLVTVLLTAALVRLLAPARDESSRNHRTRRSLLQTYLLVALGFTLVNGVFIAAFVGLFLRVAIPRPVLVLGLGLIVIFELIAFAAGYFRLRPLSIAWAESVLERTLGRVFLLHLGVFIGVFLAAAFASWFVWPFIVLKTITDVGQALQALGRRETDGAPEAPAT